MLEAVSINRISQHDRLNEKQSKVNLKICLTSRRLERLNKAKLNAKKGSKKKGELRQLYRRS